MYTDDLFLLSVFISSLQNMLNICYSYGLDNITFNTNNLYALTQVTTGSNLWLVCPLVT